MRRIAPAIAAAGAALALAAAPAGADVFEGTSLLSSSPTEQAIYAHDPVVSGDGEWVAFDGDYGGMLGVWRRAVAGGPVEPVAVGPQGTPEGSAVLPSISYDGRYISFTTTARLDPADDTNRAPDVYVRDMDAPGGGPCTPPSEAERLAGEKPACAFTLVSARNGSSEGLSYTYGSSKAAEEPFYGAIAAGRTAMNAEGNEVAFVTSAPSDLAGEGTPSLQVAVRYLASHTTKLVSVRIDPSTGLPAVNPQTGAPEPVSAVEGPETYGALFTGSGGHAPRFAAPQPREAPTPIGASLSADGSTVAWMANDVGLQAPTLPGETLPAKYTEPLWRRIGDGTLAPTRRITGGSDPLSAACRESGERVLSAPASAGDPCQGPFATFTNPSNPGIVSSLESNDDVIPRLSGNGYKVAFLANAPLLALGEGFGNGAAGHTDLYVADMRAANRVQALTPLTELASAELTSLATTAPIVDLGISPDGTQVAFTTKRTQFPLATPAYISPPSAAAGMVELFDVDLNNETLTRVTEGFEDDPSERPHEAAPTGQDPYTSPGDGALSPSFSADGNLLVFSSTAANLVYGDGNSPPADEPFSSFDGSDVFARARVVFPASAAGSDVGPLPGYPQPQLTWELGVTATSRRNGGLLIDALLPGAGALHLSALAIVPVHPSKKTNRGHSGALKERLKGVLVAARQVESKQASMVSLELHLAPRYAALATRSGGLTATLEASFAAAGHPTLHERFEVTFLRHPSHAARRRSAKHG